MYSLVSDVGLAGFGRYSVFLLSFAVIDSAVFNKGIFLTAFAVLEQ